MTVDTVFAQDQAFWWMECTGYRTVFLMAIHASGRKQNRIIHFVAMHIMTGGAIHLGRFETFAGTEKTQLIPMHIQRSALIAGIVRRGEIIQSVTGQKGERRQFFLSESGMAKGAGI